MATTYREFGGASGGPRLGHGWWLFRDRTRFPGRDAWRAHLQVQFERIASPMRLVMVLAIWLWWLLAKHPRLEGSLPLWVLLGVLAAFSLIDLLVVSQNLEVLRRFSAGSTVADLILITLIARYSGGALSPFLPLFFVFTAGAVLRLTPRMGLAFSVLYPLGYLLAAPGASFGAVADLLLALGGALWAARVQEARVEHLRDALTGIFTRSYALFHLERLSREAHAPFAIGLIDLDHFKSVNDTYGHVAGDDVLRQYVRLIGAQLRAEDLLARFGGDELIVIWPDLGLHEAMVIAERLRESVETALIPLRHSSDVVRITASIGVFEAEQGMKPIQLLRQVDQCLYKSKEIRNEVTSVAARA